MHAYGSIVPVHLELHASAASLWAYTWAHSDVILFALANASSAAILEVYWFAAI